MWQTEDDTERESDQIEIENEELRKERTMRVARRMKALRGKDSDIRSFFDIKIQLDRHYIISSTSKPSVEITSNTNVGQTLVFNLNPMLI